MAKQTQLETDTALMQECRQLISFYDDHKNDWTIALCWILFREIFGWPVHILPNDFFVKRYEKRKRIG